MKRALRNFYVVVGLIAACVIGIEPALGQEQGILPLRAEVFRVKDKSVELVFADSTKGMPTQRPVTFQILKDSRFEKVDTKLVNGKVQLIRTAITHKDLLPSQEINIIALVRGENLTVLFGVVDGQKAPAAEILKLIAKLGGTVNKLRSIGSEQRLAVDLSNSKVKDEQLQIIASLGSIAFLDLSNTSITDKGVAHLRNHRSLDELDLSRTRVTNKALDSLERLDRISVDQTAISRDALLRFAKKQNLAEICQIGAGAKSEYRVKEVLIAPGNDTPHAFLLRRGVYYARFNPDKASRRKATTYYHRDGPVGAILNAFEWFPQKKPSDNPADTRMPASLIGHSAGAIALPASALVCLWSEPVIGVVELNGGTIATYARPFQTIDFYNDIPELVPFNVKVDGKEPPFGFIEDARNRNCNVRIIEGQFKKTVRKKAPRGFYHALFVEITVQQRKDPKALKKEDVHFDLMTQEGIKDLMDKTTQDGVVCFHISHRTHEFDKPLAAAASALGFSTIMVNDRVYDRDGKRTVSDPSHFSSVWLIIARTPKHLARFQNGFADRASNLDWTIPLGDEFPAWRDGVEPEMPLRR